MSKEEIVKVIVLSGLSGAGKTVALRALEDIDYFCIDNLPVTLMDSLLSSIRHENIKKIAIGIDIREKRFLEKAYEILTYLKGKYNIEIIFLEAEKDVMIRRFKETRRPHPLMSGDFKNMEDAIDEERRLLFPIRDAADRIIDTSNYTPHQLRHLVMSDYGALSKKEGMNISLISFGYKFGIPQNIDLLFDVRFLPNPYFIAELKDLRGKDKPVIDFVLGQKDTENFLKHMKDFLDFLIPRFIHEGKNYLVIGVGCTGGRHRSPVIIEEISKYIIERFGIESNIIHRDMEI